MSSPGSIQKTGIPHGVVGQPRLIAIVPAKRNSKRCERKNWRSFTHGEAKTGQSLAELAFDKAIGTGYFDKTILTVDFPISEIEFLKKPRQPPMRLGMVVRRRPRLMPDDSISVVLDALKYVYAEPGDIYCLLQPTSPFTSKESIWRAIQIVKSQGVQCVSVNPAYKPNGCIYAGIVEHVRVFKNLYDPYVVPLVLDWAESIDIDHEHDFQIARGLYE